MLFIYTRYDEKFVRTLDGVQKGEKLPGFGVVKLLVCGHS